MSWDIVFKRLMVEDISVFQCTSTSAVAYRKIIEIIVALFKQENVSIEISGNNWTKAN